MLAPGAADAGGVTATVTRSEAGPELAAAGRTMAPVVPMQAAVVEVPAGQAVMVGVGAGLAPPDGVGAPAGCDPVTDEQPTRLNARRTADVACICRLDLRDPSSRLAKLAGPHRYPPSTAPFDLIGGGGDGGTSLSPGRDSSHHPPPASERPE